MKNVLLLGSGVSVAPLCDYLNQRGYSITIASRNETTAQELVKQHSNRSFAYLEVNPANPENDVLDELVAKSDIVVTFLPGANQPVVTECCLRHGVSLIMTCHIGYLFNTREEFETLDRRAKDRGIAIVTEAGIDPGFGSMIGKKLIDEIQAGGGEITDIWYHVGVLPANPDVNPLHYRCFWAPKKSIFASVKIKDGSGDWIKDSHRYTIPGSKVYQETTIVDVPNIGRFESRPNSDSGAYLYPEVYGIENVKNFYQGTLRYPGWGETFQGLIDLGFSDTQIRPELAQKTYREIILELCGEENSTTDSDAKAAVASKLSIPVSHQVILNFEWLGLFEEQPILPPKDSLSYCDVISDLLVNKLGVYQPGDQDIDRVVMYYDILATYPDGKKRVTSIANLTPREKQGDYSICSTITSQTAAMIAARILAGSLNIKGLKYPSIPEIYEPILHEYAQLGFTSSKTTIAV